MMRHSAGYVRRGGFTLIEILIALAILSVAGITLVESNTVSMHLWNRHRETVIVRQLLERKMAEAEVNALSGSKSDSGEFEGVHSGYTWDVESRPFEEQSLYELTCTITTPTGREYKLTYIYFDVT
jgi:type II secretion system protein I